VTDRDLAQRCARGERQAWDELVALHDRRIALVLLRALGQAFAGDLPDLRQEVYARLLANHGAALLGLRAERPGSLAAFLAQTALRVAIDHRRARRARPSAAEGLEALVQLEEGGETPEAHAGNREERALLEAALLRVVQGDPRDLLVLRAHLHDGLNAAEIAGMGIGLTAKGVETLLRRAKERLRAEFEQAAVKG